MKDISYLDNSATTAPCDEAIRLLNNALLDNWGNPSSLHTIGINAELIVNSCKKTCAEFIGSREDEIFFTSGGTEANNLAISGAIAARAKRGNRIVTTAIEHPSVLETIKSFEAKGFEVVYLSPDSDGIIPESELEKAITKSTILVSIMLVNNEIGSIQPVSAAAKFIKASGAPALLHCDAVQAFGKLPINVATLGADLITVSGHKIHAPKGIGFLYKKKGVHITPTVYGGGQQNGVRPGTEPVPLIAALEGAIKSLPAINDSMKQISSLNRYAREALESTGVVEFNSGDNSLPYLLNISVPGYRSETMLHFLDAQGVYVSSGSACAKGELSHTLSALKLDRRRIDSAIRISFSRYNDNKDIDRLCAGIVAATQKLKKV